MRALLLDVYQVGRQWFWRCPWCAAFDGAFRTRREASVALYGHKLRRHTP